MHGGSCSEDLSAASDIFRFLKAGQRTACIERWMAALQHHCCSSLYTRRVAHRICSASHERLFMASRACSSVLSALRSLGV